MTETMGLSRDSQLLRIRLRQALDAARHDAAVFALLTVLLTPVFLVGGAIVVVFALSYVDLPLIDHLGYTVSVVTGANLGLAFMVASYFLRPKRANQESRSDYFWLVIAGGIFCALLVVSYGSLLPSAGPAVFWTVYFLLALGMLGCIGNAYEPHDSYYLGWRVGSVMHDNGLTIRDDIDRAHFALGFAVSLANLVLVSYGEVFGSTWLWRGLTGPELSESAELLVMLADKEIRQAQSRMETVGTTAARNSVRALAKLEFVTVESGTLHLSRKGWEFLGGGTLR